MEQPAAAAPGQPPAAPTGQAPLPLRFTGSAGQYFGIWIVNMLLSIVTLGIYSAWAKVRRLQYFYRHTELAGSGFDFHGRPTAILFGRVVALLMLGLYQYSVRLHSPLTLLAIVALALVMPWLLRNSFRFRLYNSSWRGTRFHFRGGLGGAYRVFLLNGFLTLLTLYLLAPFTHQRIKAYQHDNTWFGRTRCSFHASAGRFYLLYLLMLAAIVAAVVLVVLTGAGMVFTAVFQARQGGAHVDPRALMRSLALFYGIIVLFAVSVGPAFQALLANLVWSNTRVGEHRIECHMNPARMAWIGASNLLLVIGSLGLAIPFAQVRVARYQVDSMRVLPAGDLQDIQAADDEAPSAIGEEAAVAFDFDISL